MKCFYHPMLDAVAQCTQCHKGICTQCAHDFEGDTFCPGCIKVGITQEIAQAKRAITMMYVVVGGVTGLATLGALLSVISAISQGGASQAGSILVVPLVAVVAFVQWWCLYWGWGPTWGAFSRFFAGWGCFGTIGFLFIIGAILLEFLLIGAFFVGLFTGIQRFLEARKTIANGDQALAMFAVQPANVINSVPSMPLNSSGYLPTASGSMPTNPPTGPINRLPPSQWMTAPRSPDGAYWWDGVAWQPVPQQ